MKKSEYRTWVWKERHGETPKGGWGRVFRPQAPGSKLSRKASEGRVGARTVGVVSKAYETMARNKRAA